MNLMRILAICGCCLSSLGFAATSDSQSIGEPKTFRTGLVGKGGDFAVSPDGARLVFGTGRLEHGLRLIDLRTGRIDAISMESGRIWEMPNWSAAGTQVVAISTAVQNNRYIVGDMQVILIDPVTWKSRTISSGDGVKIFPMFSTDGKAVYYFKGKKRESGATPASRYDLYAIDLSSGQETRLTHEEIYQVGRGDEQGGTVLFSAYGLRGYPSRYFDKILKRIQEQTGLYLRNNANGTITPIRIDQGGEIFNFYHPRRDRAGNIYFIANTSPPRSQFKFWLCRASPDGKAPAFLAEVSASTELDIAIKSGEIYLLDKQGDEIVFRRLSWLAEH